MRQLEGRGLRRSAGASHSEAVLSHASNIEPFEYPSSLATTLGYLSMYLGSVPRHARAELTGGLEVGQVWQASAVGVIRPHGPGGPQLWNLRKFPLYTGVYFHQVIAVY